MQTSHFEQSQHRPAPRRRRFGPSPQDFVRPADRVPREPSAAPALSSILVGIGFFFLAIWALPDLSAWVSSWGICR
jgi:hypothetical protein